MDGKENNGKVYLNRQQVSFLYEMLEMNNTTDAVQAFAKILEQEGADPGKMAQYIDKIIENRNKKPPLPPESK